MNFLQKLLIIVFIILGIKNLKLKENLSQNEYDQTMREKNEEYERLENAISTLNNEISNYNQNIKNEENKIVNIKVDQFDQTGKIFDSKKALNKIYNLINFQKNRLKL